MQPAQIVILDTGGQYCHLIARKVRELGVSSEVFPSETATDKLRHARGVIVSGGPHSVYDKSSPVIERDLLSAGIPVLGICYGQQLIAHLLGGSVRKGDKGEFGLAILDLIHGDSPLLKGVADHRQIWMSHRDVVAVPPPGFRVLASTSTCETAAIEDPSRRLFGVQFHPEVVHTAEGARILENFVFGISGCVKDWNPGQRVTLVEEQIRLSVGDRNVFFFVSGGVDSTVAFTLCLRALGPERVRGVYVDTGLMREGETEFVERTFSQLGSASIQSAAQSAVQSAVEIARCEAEFLQPLELIREPELKRHVIGEQFVRVQERIIESRGLLDGHWILGQGTIYPDTIESGGATQPGATSKAATIKTHHNRVPGIQKLMDAGRIVEPLADFYKDEVRAIGRQLDLPAELLNRHPFPGPGLAIRCLCSEIEEPVTRIPEGWLIPVRSVGVQGDSRSYAPVLAIESLSQEEATELVNRTAGVNRVIAVVTAREALARQRVFASSITHGRVALLRRADAIVRQLCHASEFESSVWQFPVILIPLGAGESRDSIVLRPVQSVDGMTADSVAMPANLLREMAARLMAIPEIAGVYYDLTHKPPGTIEWE
ncbi:MAG: glutamine-hydrolyzing GMP synthase [Acidobacteriota bacterium]|nr:glutamine-hydrolyzing GMP synthase [Acidobacteriota bacterium]